MQYDEHFRRKIVGARYYIKGYLNYYKKLNATEDCMSPRDMDGHGTHTASTVAGRQVHDAAAFGGFASGTAKGGAPLARLAYTRRVGRFLIKKKQKATHVSKKICLQP